jgi:membrane protein implicated in regulation of membrane protease activity
MDWLVWIIIGAALILAEIFSASFFAGPIGLGCLIAAIMAKAGFSVSWQLMIFGSSSILLLLIVRPIWKKMMDNNPKDLESGVDRYEGRPGTITETVDPDSGEGRVKIGGESWRAISDKNIVIETGSRVTVLRVEGTKAVVSVSENP